MVHFSLRGGQTIPTPTGLSTADFIPIAHSRETDLKVQMIRDLEVVGQVPDLEIIPAILPVIVMGNVLQQTVRVEQPVFRSTDVFSNGLQTAPAAGEVLADTGPLATGVYDLQVYSLMAATGFNNIRIEFQHRNAANAANLASWDYGCRGHSVANETTPVWVIQTLAYELAENERLRLIVPVAFAAGDPAIGTIFARRR